MAEDQAVAVRNWGQALGLTYPLLLDVNGDVYNQYAKDYLPYFVVLDTGGTVRYSSESYDENTVVNLINAWLPTGVGDDAANESSPRSFRLYQNYPNPFNSSTRIDYQLLEPSHVSVAIVSVGGQLIRTLVDDMKGVGRFSILWDGKDDAGGEVASGIYVCRLQVGGAADARKIALSR
jgi:hypothetical protein